MQGKSGEEKRKIEKFCGWKIHKKMKKLHSITVLS